MNDTVKPRSVESLSAIEAISAAEQFVRQGQARLAINVYRGWLDSHGQDAAAYAIAFNLGVVLKDQGEEDEAEQAYRRAIELNPNCLEAHFNLGSQLERLKRPQEAVEQWQAMLDSGKFSLPQDARLYQLTLNNLGRLLEILKEYERAEQMLDRSLRHNPDQADALQHWIYLRQKQCRWPVYADIPGVSRAAMLQATGPLSVLAAAGEPEQQLERVVRYAQEKIPVPGPALAAQEPYGHARLRIGYLSSDLCLHPVAMLTVELFELHDRARVEVYGFCWSREDGSALRQRVIQSFDHYIQIGGMSDEEAARHIRALEIDVLVDLHGLTLGSRPGILAWRPAPVQITYLGFPGTTGIPGVDYVLADRFIVPESEARHFSETPLYLSRCFQVSDRQREVGPTPTRASCGLPEDAFVFCSFNNNYKFTPEIFAVWMRILHRVPGSVLWLLADNRWAQENLCQAAEAAGIARERLIFAGRVAPADYLARYRIADLFLDNQPFGAGTTANDALWQGLPLLTCPGRNFASRMAGSLLNTLGCPELIAEGLEDYEQKAVAIGNDPERAALIRKYLHSRVRHSPLFDIPARVKEIESLYFQAAGLTRQRPRTADFPLPYELSKPDLGSFFANYAKSTRRPDIRLAVVSATRAAPGKFWQESALGLSLRRLGTYIDIVPKIAFENQRGLPEIYNDAIASDDAADIVLFVHDDVWIEDYFLVDRLLAGLAQYDILGVAGNRKRHAGQPGWAFTDDSFAMDSADHLSGLIAHGPRPFGAITTFGASAAECELLDGVFLAAWKRTLQSRKVLFDPRFDFHFYDLDFCRSARLAGLKLGTWPICITHQSEGSYHTAKWQQARRLYQDKWHE